MSDRVSRRPDRCAAPPFICALITGPRFATRHGRSVASVKKLSGVLNGVGRSEPELTVDSRYAAIRKIKRKISGYTIAVSKD